MKKIALMLLVLFLAGCASQPAETPAKTTETSTDTSSNYVETPQTETVKPATTTQTRTSKTYYFVMTVDDDGFNPRVLTVPWSERSKITLTNEDSSEHSFDVPQLSIAYTLKAKETVVIDFVPATKGDFKIDDRFTGNDGELIVGGET